MTDAVGSSAVAPDSFATSLVAVPKTFDDELDEMASLLLAQDANYAPLGRPALSKRTAPLAPSQPKQMQVVTLADRPFQAPEIQNLCKAVDLVAAAEESAIAAGLLTQDEVNGTLVTASEMSTPDLGEANAAYNCDAECNHESGGACSAACRQWQSVWDPIVCLLTDACNDNASTFRSLSTSTTAVSSLTAIQAKFASLIAENTTTEKNKSPFARNAFIEKVYRVLCDEIGADFYRVRSTIQNQMCCVDTAAAKVSDLMKDVLRMFAIDTDTVWLTKDPAAMGRHLKSCKPEHLSNHIETLDSTGAQLAVFEKEMYQLAAGCTNIIAHMRAQLDALHASMPATKRKTAAAVVVVDWVRTPPTEHESDLDVWGNCMYGHDDTCTEEKFRGGLRAFLDTESNCSLLVRDGVVFFRDCYENLAWYMEQHVKRAEEMHTAFQSLGQALVQQRFIVHIGAFMLRTLAKKELQTQGTAKETPIDIFGILFGPRFQPSLQSSDFIQIQIELNSNGEKLPGTLRSYLMDVYTAPHLNAIQESARAMFTTELDSLGAILAEFGARNGQITQKKDDSSSSSIVEMRRLVQAVVKYMEKKHPCTTKHCDCCQVSKTHPKIK